MWKVTMGRTQDFVLRSGIIAAISTSDITRIVMLEVFL